MENPYLPYPVRIDDIIVEAEDKSLKTFKFVFLNDGDEEKFAYNAGQFAELSIPGKGEIPIGIASSPTLKKDICSSSPSTRCRRRFPPRLHNMKVKGISWGCAAHWGTAYPLQEGLEGKHIWSLSAGGFRGNHAAFVHRLYLAASPGSSDPKYGNIDLYLRGQNPGHAAYTRMK